MEKKRMSLLIEGCVFFLMGIGLLIYSVINNAKVMQQYWSISPYMMSTIIAAAMIFIGGGFVVKALIGAREKASEVKKNDAAAASNSPNWKGIFCTMAMVVLYVVLMPIIRFFPATVLFLSGFIFFLGERKPLRIALISIITSGVLYVLFDLLLNVMLP